MLHHSKLGFENRHIVLYLLLVKQKLLNPGFKLVGIKKGSMIKVGDKAPDFVLKDPEGNEISLQSQLGDKSVLLYFYPADWSPVCTTQLGGFCSLENEFEKLGTKIIAISADHGFSHKAFRDKLGAKFLFLSGTKEVLEKYGVYLPNIGFANRAYFVLDKSGVVRFSHIMPSPPEMLENSKLLTLIKDLKEKMNF